jgi:hypothetical protein
MMPIPARPATFGRVRDQGRAGQVPDVVVRFAARFLDRSLGWAPRPARETVLDCARSLIAHGVA